jgi:hypothetical protein
MLPFWLNSRCRVVHHICAEHDLANHNDVHLATLQQWIAGSVIREAGVIYVQRSFPFLTASQARPLPGATARYVSLNHGIGWQRPT